MGTTNKAVGTWNWPLISI